MRGGMTPQRACEEAVGRIAARQDYKSFQIGYLAINKSGEHGAFAIHKGFSYALHQGGENKMHNAKYLIE
jgi:N4-(beta-N-acetylglucosaminyl)-L-asparaginase